MFLLLLVLGTFTACDKAEDKVAKGIIEQVESYQGYQREISKEEYDLYTYFVKREAAEELTDEELADRVEAYANRVNAVFHLANKLNLCEPYSYEVLKLRMEQENEIRKVKKDNGEAIYGLEQFTLENFFQYQLSLVEAEIRTYLEGQVDEEIVKEAKEYYEANKDAFRIREKVVYEVTLAGETKEETADREDINFLQDADPALADYLQLGKEGDSFTDFQGEGERKVVIKEIHENEDGFEKNREAAISYYISQKLYPYLIDTVAKNNPVVCRFNIDK